MIPAFRSSSSFPGSPLNCTQGLGAEGVEREEAGASLAGHHSASARLSL